MTGRLETIAAAAGACRVFADIGCDHGYCTRYMLRNKLCERAYITDISAKSLSKAVNLLREEIAEGRCFPVVTDGLDGIPELPDCVLIAGMGGEEIVKILSRTVLPARFVLQPMKNSPRVREFLLGRGARITRDITFGDGGKYYDLIVGDLSGGDMYSARELRYGRDNLKGLSEAFVRQQTEEIGKLELRLAGPALSPRNREIFIEKKNELEEIIHEITRDL